MWVYLLTALAVSLSINVAMFVVAYKRSTDKLTDASYALTFIVLAAYGLVQAPLSPFRIILFCMITIWAARLGGFLLFRIWKTGRDRRFDDKRNNLWKFGTFWVSQGLAVWIILVPSLLALRHEPTLSTVAWVTIAAWLGGLLIEAAADLQKYRFSSSPSNKGKWIATGLWRFSRHPNYFGEIIVWAATYIYACTALSLPETVVGAASPLFIAGLLLFVSGIPILEKSADARWGKQAAYREYKQRTSLLFLWPVKKP